METEIEVKNKKQPVKMTAGQTPAEMILAAVQNNSDLDKLKGLMELQERWDANEARKAYYKAISAFKAEAPKILKDKKVNFGAGKAAYSHASLQNVVEQISSKMSKFGLSATWRIQQEGAPGNRVGVTCRITHELGHFEETTMWAPPDDSGSKNKIQQIGSTTTYLQRYTLLSLTGLATYDQDDDGAGADTLIEEKQLHELRDMIISTGADEVKFLSYLGIESLDKLLASDFQKAKSALKAKVKK